MMLGELREKEFIKAVIGRYADTAVADRFDDCVTIDLERVCRVAGLPFLVYSLDHPSFIRPGLGLEADHRFYGRWVAACVCGDVLAMGARPRGFALDLAAPLDLDVQAVEWILLGIRDVLDTYGATFEGGNFDANALELVGYAWGVVPRDRIVRRGGAREGDYVVATTVLGFGWADYATCRSGLSDRLSVASREAFRAYKLLPLAPCEAILQAVEMGGITSGMDLSDGLVEFLYTIGERSGLGVRLEERCFPVAPEMEEAARLLGVRPTLLALEPGYDTPLSHGWTISPEAWEPIREIFRKHGATVVRYGTVTREREVVVDTARGLRAIAPFWDDQLRKGDLLKRWLTFVSGL